jgi:uncharacterized protein (AIM24 family)
MIYFDVSIDVNTKKGSNGVWSSVKRTFAGQSFFVNEFTAQKGDAILGLSPFFVGDIAHLKLKAGEEWILFSGAYLASSPSIDTSAKFSGFEKGFFSGENMFYLFNKAKEESDCSFLHWGVS